MASLAVLQFNFFADQKIQQRLFAEIQQDLIYRKLKPTIITTYKRTAFQ